MINEFTTDQAARHLGLSPSSFRVLRNATDSGCRIEASRAVNTQDHRWSMSDMIRLAVLLAAQPSLGGWARKRVFGAITDAMLAEAVTGSVWLLVSTSGVIATDDPISLEHWSHPTSTAPHLVNLTAMVQSRAPWGQRVEPHLGELLRRVEEVVLSRQWE